MKVDKEALKRATRELVAATGGQEACIGFSRIKRHQAFSDYGSASEQHAATFMPADVIADLEGVTSTKEGHPLVTRELARQQGYQLVRLPLPGARGSLSLAEHLPTIIRESADVTLLLSTHLSKLETYRTEAVRDGAAVQNMRREIAGAIRALVECDAALQELQA